MFFGISDAEGKIWAKSQVRVIKLCSDKLGLIVLESGIDRAHREGISRCIMTKFCFFEEEETILCNAFLLKGSGILISEGFPLGIATSRRGLLAFQRFFKL